MANVYAIVKTLLHDTVTQAKGIMVCCAQRNQISLVNWGYAYSSFLHFQQSKRKVQEKLARHLMAIDGKAIDLWPCVIFDPVFTSIPPSGGSI